MCTVHTIEFTECSLVKKWHAHNKVISFQNSLEKNWAYFYLKKYVQVWVNGLLNNVSAIH